MLLRKRNKLTELVVLRDVLWLVFGVAAAMFGLSGLLLGGVDTSAWTFGGWMDVLRTAATVFGIGLAVKAYNVWRVQERAKRKATAAENILLAAFETATAIRDARHIRASPIEPTTEALIKIFINMVAMPEVMQDVEASAVPAAKLRSLEPVARVYFGPEAAESMRKIYLKRENVKGSLDYILRVKQYAETDGKHLDREQRMVTLLARTMGLHVSADKIDEQKTDRFERQLAGYLEDLQKRLTPFLVYEGE